uniref:PCI domain-containing protein n=1 Tax=Vannella robusta TaxID=1487602 RepID=A0A7S4M5K9_9EUKA|mmetsp:Transcript_12248/g.15247  ORF Transcript_12248/g.15247 Transcript_12248/m.15247 type:complete len:163 (+) Transcript_12248:439-927(+)
MQYTILGLNLLRLLANNQIADFHTELELIPTEMLDNTFIKHPIQLEQYLMEGSYTKIIESRNEVPSSTYSNFMEQLVHTVRDEIAACSEKAYAYLSVDQATKLFMFQPQELNEFCEQRGWMIDGNRIVFNQEEEQEEDKRSIPSSKVIARTLLYARELERIV